MFRVSKAREIVRSHGYAELIRRTCSFLYKNTLRPYLPREGYYFKNDVKWRRKKPLDSVFLSERDDPEYEAALITALRNEVQPNETVGVLGGGRGISTVVAAKKSATGAVFVYEASLPRIDIIKNTLALNDVENIVEVNHALVGPNIQVYGELGSAQAIDPSKLPEFDVLEIDCEGAELEILSNLFQRPRVIIVEVHPKNSTKKEITEILEDMNYEVVDTGWENEQTNNPLPILTARHNGSE